MYISVDESQMSVFFWIVFVFVWMVQNIMFF